MFNLKKTLTLEVTKLHQEKKELRNSIARLIEHRKQLRYDEAKMEEDTIELKKIADLLLDVNSDIHEELRINLNYYDSKKTKEALLKNIKLLLSKKDDYIAKIEHQLFVARELLNKEEK